MGAVQSILDLIYEHSDQRPDAPAILAPGRQPFSYRVLREFITSTAVALHLSGIDDRGQVALLVSNGPEALTSFLTVSSVATCVPIDPDTPPAELRSRFEGGRLRAVILDVTANPAARELAEACGLAVYVLEPDGLGPAGTFRLLGPAGMRTGEPTWRHGDDVAVVLRTSGTTGSSKSVPLTHANLCAAVKANAKAFGLSPTDRDLNFLPLFHVFGLVGTVATLAAGGSVVCLPALDVSRFTDWLREYQPTTFAAVPAMHRAILESLKGAGRVQNPSSLRFIRSAAGALPSHVAEALEEALGAPLIENYGLTETASHAASHPLPPRPRKLGSAGLGNGCELRIGNVTGVRVPPRTIGEIFVRGERVFCGYAEDSGPESASFLNDGWFRTGDLGYLDEEGYLFVTGRLKEMIKRGGESISPGEVDAVLLQHPLVSDAVAFAVPHPVLGEDLAIAVVVRSGVQVTGDEIRRFIAERMPRSRVPSQVVFLDQIPTGSTRKVSRVGFAERLGLCQGADLASGEKIRPRNSIENDLTLIWQKALGVREVGVTDDFFSLGGTSLLAIQVFWEIERAYGRKLPVSLIFVENTIEKLAQALAKQTALGGTLVPVQPSGTKPPLFCPHDRSGDIMPLRRLALHLGTDQPLYGLRFPRHLARDGSLNVPEIARHYVEEVRRFQPFGPYYLAGYSLGGVIAFEMAQQLESNGQRVALLAIIDMENPGRYPVKPVNLGHRLRRAWKMILEAPAQDRLAVLWRKANRAPSAVALPIGDRLSNLMGGEVTTSEVETALVGARFRYKPGRYQGRITVFRAVENPWNAAREPHLGWAEVAAGGVEVYDLPGNHKTVVSEGANVLADRLRECLMKAQAENADCLG